MLKKRNIAVLLILILLMVACSNSPSSSVPTNNTISEEENNVDSSQKYPTRPITVIVPWGTGGGSDQMNRALHNAAESVSDVRFVIQNMPGAAGLTGLNHTMQQPADGYTIYSIITDQIVQMVTGETDHTLDDIIPIIQSQAVLNMLFIKSDETRFTNFEELVEYAKSNDGQVTIGTTGLNSFDAALFAPIEEKYGFTFNNIPYNAPAERYGSLQGGFVDVLFEQIGDVKQFVDSDEFKPILLYHNERLEEFPEMPTTLELNIDQTMPYSRGIVAKKGTPQEVIEVLQEVYAKAVETEDWKKFNEEQVALSSSYLNSEDFTEALEETYKALQLAIEE